MFSMQCSRCNVLDVMFSMQCFLCNVFKMGRMDVINVINLSGSTLIKKNRRTHSCILLLFVKFYCCRSSLLLAVFIIVGGYNQFVSLPMDIDDLDIWLGLQQLTQFGDIDIHTPSVEIGVLLPYLL